MQIVYDVNWRLLTIMVWAIRVLAIGGLCALLGDRWHLLQCYLLCGRDPGGQRGKAGVVLTHLAAISNYRIADQTA
jgi:hypothetical protein